MNKMKKIGAVMLIIAMITTMINSFSNGLFASDGDVTMSLVSNVTDAIKKGNSISFTTNIKNNTAQDIEDTQLTFTVPKGLSLNQSDIKIDGQQAQEASFDNAKNLWTVYLGKAKDVSLQQANVKEDSSEEALATQTQTIHKEHVLSANEEHEITLTMNITAEEGNLPFAVAFQGIKDKETIKATKDTTVAIQKEEAKLPTTPSTNELTDGVKKKIGVTKSQNAVQAGTWIIPLHGDASSWFTKQTVVLEEDSYVMNHSQGDFLIVADKTNYKLSYYGGVMGQITPENINLTATDDFRPSENSVFLKVFGHPKTPYVLGKGTHTLTLLLRYSKDGQPVKDANLTIDLVVAGSHGVHDSDMSYTPTLSSGSLSNLKAGTIIGKATTKTGAVFSMGTDAVSQLFNIDAAGTVTTKNDIATYGNLEFSIVSSLEGTSASVKGSIKVGASQDMFTYTPSLNRTDIVDAKKGLEIGILSTSYTGFQYTMDTSGASGNFSIDQNGIITLKNDITTAGTYDFAISATHQDADPVLISAKLEVTPEKIIKISKIKADGTLGTGIKYANFSEAYAGITAKDVYQIQFLKDYVETPAEMDAMNKFLDDKTTRFIMTGLQNDGTTHSTLSIAQSWVIGGNDNSVGNTLENLKIKYTGSNSHAIFANGNTTIFGNGVENIGGGEMSVFAGKYSKSTEITSASSHLVIQSGSWGRVQAGGVNNTITGDAYIELSGSASAGSVGAGGITSIDSETAGEVKGTGTAVISGNATTQIYPITCYNSIMEYDFMPKNTYMGGNVKHVVVNVLDKANITGFGPNVHTEGPSFKTKHGYILGDYDINISGQASIGNIRVGSQAPGSVQSANGGLSGDGDVNITINGFASLGAIDCSYTNNSSMKGKKNLIINTTSNVTISSIKNVDEIIIGKANKAEVTLASIVQASLADVSSYPNVTMMNDSKAIFTASGATINNLTSNAKANSFIIDRGIATKPVLVNGTFSGDPLYLNTSSVGADNDILLTFANEANAKAENYVSSNKQFAMAKEKANIIFVESVKFLEISKINGDGTTTPVGEYIDFDDANTSITSKDMYQIRLLSDYDLTSGELSNLNKFLDDKTTRFIITGLQKDKKTISKLNFADGLWQMGGNDAKEGNRIENVAFTHSSNLQIFANGNKVTFGDGVDTGSGNVYLFGGERNLSAVDTIDHTDITVLSGTYRELFGGGINSTVTNDGNVRIGGLAKVTFVSGSGLSTSSVAENGKIANAHVKVNGNAVVDKIYGAAALDNAEPGVLGMANTACLGNVGNTEITLGGNSVVERVVAGSLNGWISAAPASKRGYIFGDCVVNVVENAEISTAIYGGSEVYLKLGSVNKFAGDGNFTVNVEGAKKPIVIDGVSPLYSNSMYRMKGEHKVNINGSGNLVSSIIDMDKVIVGQSGKVDSTINLISKPWHLFTKNMDVIFQNGSTLSLTSSSMVKDITSTGVNTVKITKGNPLNITGTVTGDVINLEESGAAVGDELIKPTTSVYAQFKTSNTSFTLAEKKANYILSYTDKKVMDGKLSKVTQKELDHIDAPTITAVKKDLHFTLHNSEDADYRYGDLKASDATHSDAYISNQEVSDATWVQNGTLPKGAEKVEITADGNAWLGTITNVSMDSTKCYYLHMRNERGVASVFTIDVNGATVAAKAGEEPSEDEQGLRFEYQLKDGMPTSALTYTPSGITQVSFSLNGANDKALADTFQSYAGTSDAFYGIQTFTANVQQDYVLSIPEDLQKEIQQGSKTVYLYVKDALGNTSVSTVFVGDYLLNMDVTTKASVIAVNGVKKEVIAPVVKLYNFGAHKVNVKAGMRKYQEQAGKLKLVEDKSAYATDELALHMIPVQNVNFQPINVKKLEPTLLDLGDLSILNKKDDSNYKAFTFDGAFSDTIDKTLQENSFVLEYHITPILH